MNVKCSKFKVFAVRIKFFTAVKTTFLDVCRDDSSENTIPKSNATLVFVSIKSLMQNILSIAGE